MDLAPANWVLECLLRLPLEEQTLKSLLLAVPPPNDNPRITKSLLLKKLEFSISGSSVTEETLELLGQLKELENETPSSDTMKQAFCETAVECTLNHLKAADGEEHRLYKFYEAARRIWMERVNKSVERGGGLGSEALWEWEEEIKASVFHDDAANRLLNKAADNVNGVEAVNSYIREEWHKMGSLFLEILYEKAKTDQTLQAILGIGGIASPPAVNEEVAGADNVNTGGIDQVAVQEASPSGVNEDVAGASNVNGDGEMNKGKRKLRQKHLALRPTRGSRKKLKLSDSAKVREAPELNSLDLKAVVKDHPLDAIKIEQAVSGEARDNKSQPPASSTQAPGGNTSTALEPEVRRRQLEIDSISQQ